MRKIVLIETLWNVKSAVHPVGCYYFTVLIETLWNVKISFRDDGIDLTMY